MSGGAAARPPGKAQLILGRDGRRRQQSEMLAEVVSEDLFAEGRAVTMMG